MANRNVWAAVKYLRDITRNILTPNNVAIDQNVTDGIERGVVKQQKLGCQNQGGGGGGRGWGEERMVAQLGKQFLLPKSHSQRFNGC